MLLLMHWVAAAAAAGARASTTPSRQAAPVHEHLLV
jgi:hypothetical protein